MKHQELQVLMEIQENPFITFEELAQRTNISKTVVFRIIKKLEDPSIKPPYLKIVAIPNLRALNLESIDVFIEAELPHELKSIHNLCHEHPYIWYYARCYGKMNGYAIQYRTPKGTVPQILDLLDILKTKALIRNYYVLNFEGNAVYTHPQVKNWDLETLSWNFDWKDWFKKKVEKITTPQQKFNDLQKSVNFQLKDLQVLRELLHNSRRKNIEMIGSMARKGWNISQQQFSKKANFLKKHFILDYRAEIHPEALDITIPVLMWGRGDLDSISNLTARLKQFPIPFHSTFKYQKTLVFWYLHISNIQLAELLLYLRPMLSELHFFFIDQSHSEIFLLEISNYDEAKKDWIKTDKFQIQDVLAKILKTQ